MEDLGRSMVVSGDAVERDEHVSKVLRLRRVCAVAVVAWPAFGLADWFVVTFVQPGRLWFYLTLRALGLLPILISVVVTFGGRMPGPAMLRWTEALTSASLSVLITISCIELGGIVSPLVLGVMLILLVRAAIIADRWQLALLPIGLVAAAHPVTLAAMAPFDEAIAAQFHDPRALAGFILNQMFLGAAAAVTLIGGHMMWALRRQVFQARSLGRYRLKHQIGAGGMGEVWAAHHHALKRDVAVKILRPETRGDPLAVARFEREVRSTAELVHPNTVRVFDYGVTEDGLWYYAMELLQGQDLHAIVMRDGPLEPLRAVHLMYQASKALAEAHARGITHRDVKPENLFVTAVDGEGEFVKVLDFGLAKLTRRDQSTVLTADGWAVGTPRWASPEVVVGTDADPRSDVYGLGAVLYFLLTGAPPFDYPDVGRMLQAHLNETPRPPVGRGPIPRAIETIVMRCLEKEPSRRFASAGELARAFEAVLAGAPVQRAYEVSHADHAPARPVASGSREWAAGQRPPMPSRSPHATAALQDDDPIDDVTVRRPPLDR